MLAYDSTVNIFGFPGAIVQPLAPSDLITTVYFVPLARRLSQVPGVLVDSISFGSFRVAWDVRAPDNSLTCVVLTSYPEI